MNFRYLFYLIAALIPGLISITAHAESIMSPESLNQAIQAFCPYYMIDRHVDSESAQAADTSAFEFAHALTNVIVRLDTAEYNEVILKLYQHARETPECEQADRFLIQVMMDPALSPEKRAFVEELQRQTTGDRIMDELIIVLTTIYFGRKAMISLAESEKLAARAPRFLSALKKLSEPRWAVGALGLGTLITSADSYCYQLGLQWSVQVEEKELTPQSIPQWCQLFSQLRLNPNDLFNYESNPGASTVLK